MAKYKKNKPYQLMFNFLNAAGFNKRYRTYKACPGTIELLHDRGGGEMEYVPLDELSNDIIKILNSGKDIDLGPADARPMAHWWVVNNFSADGLKELPVPVMTKTEKGLCFKRLHFDYRPYKLHAEPVHFLEFCGRSSDPDVLQAFIGSIFVPNSYRQQYLYLFGEGSDGKGTLFNLLDRMLGQTFIAEDVPKEVAPFWSSGLIGKRLCVFPDLERSGFPMTPRFRKLTGDDSIRVEEKFKKQYSTKIFTKFIFASNDELQMTSRKADKRRALYVAMKSFRGQADNQYLDKLWEEAPAIYALCLDKYNKLTTKHGPIRQEAVDELQYDVDCETDAFFDRYFNSSPKGHITGADWLNAQKHYFKRSPNGQENQMLLGALKKRYGGSKIRKAQGIIVTGITKKSHMQLVQDGGNWPL